MKKIILIIALTLTWNITIGQNFSELAEFEFISVESYKPAENQVLICANYLLENPSDQAELNRLNSLQYILKWMTGTPDYLFDIGEKATDLTKGNSDLLGLYMAAMTKVVLENTGEKLNSDQIYEVCQEILIEYCFNSNNNIKPSRMIKKIVKSRKD